MPDKLPTMFTAAAAEMTGSVVLSGAAAARTAVVLVNWNGWRDAVECLSSLLASDAAGAADIYLVDNDSSDGSVQHIVDWCASPQSHSGSFASFDGVQHLVARSVSCAVWLANGQTIPAGQLARVNVVRSGGNLGFAGGNNVGIVAAGVTRYDHFWLLNTDTVIRHDALQQLLKRAAVDPAVGMVGSTLVYYGEPGLVQAMGGARLDLKTVIPRHIGDREPVASVPAASDAVERDMTYIVGASMLVSQAFVRRVGLMQDDYFLYYEEADWAFRGRPDFRLAYSPASVVYHKVGGSSTQVMSEYALRVLYRSRVRFTSRFLPGSLASVRRMLAFEVARHLLKGRWMPARVAAATLFTSGRLAASAPSVPPMQRPAA